MNDAMSLGVHRLWKDAMLDWLAPWPGMRLLDVAGGTGDIAFRFLRRVKGAGHATVLDMTEDMLAEGRAARRGDRPSPTRSTGWSATRWRCPSRTPRFDAYTISFGIRNVTRIEDALAEAFRVLRPGGRLLVLEFSRVPERRRCAGSTTAIRSTSSRRSGQVLAGDRATLPVPRRIDPPLPRPGDLRRHDRAPPASGRCATATSRWASPRCTRAGSSEVRGPHNLWRLIRTGATFERTGAMRLALEALDAPPALRVAARVLGWPFQWLGLEGDPTQPPILRALTALGPAYIKFGQLLSTRPDVVGAELAAPAHRAAGQAAALPDAEARAAIEHELGQPVDAVFSDFERAGRRRLARPGAPRDPARDRAGGGGQGAAPRHRARLPARRRRLLPRRLADRDAGALRPPAAAARGDRAFRGRGAGRARPAHGGRGGGGVRGQHRARPRLPGAGGDLAGLRRGGC